MAVSFTCEHFNECMEFLKHEELCARATVNVTVAKMVAVEASIAREAASLAAEVMYQEEFHREIVEAAAEAEGIGVI